MRNIVRRAVSSVLLLVGLILSIGVSCTLASVAQAAVSASVNSSESPLAGPLVIPEEQLLDGYQQQRFAAQAAWSNPGAVTARDLSRTRYAHESAPQAASTLVHTFPSLVNQVNGGLPHLPAADRFTGFANAHLAQVDLPSGERSLVESLAPMALPTSSHGWTPVDLALHERAGVFAPVRPDVAVELSTRLSHGAQLPRAGVTVVPVSEAGAPLGGSEGVADGASVFFANTQTDTDTLVKPATLGFEFSSILRSAESPERLYFHVQMPRGARLSYNHRRSPAAEILEQGVPVVTIPVPSAQDAAGAVVPVAMAVSGSTIVLTVAHRFTSYMYPIVVDPEFDLASEGLYDGNWHFQEAGGFFHGGNSEQLYAIHEGAFPRGDWGSWEIAAKGYTKLYETEMKDNLFPTYEDTQLYNVAATYPFLDAWWEMFNSGGVEARQTVSGAPMITSGAVCANSEDGCTPKGVANANALRFELTTLEDSEEVGRYLQLYENSIYGGDVDSGTTLYYAQEYGKHSTVSQNRENSELDKTRNVLYGAGSWLGPNSGALEVKAKDGGLGVWETALEYDGKSGWERKSTKKYAETAACIGIQCNEGESEVLTATSLKSLPLVNGENTVRFSATSPFGSSWSSEVGEGAFTLKYDNAAPHAITVSGLTLKGEALEVGEVEAHVKVQATDGEGTTPSSGVQSLAIEVDQKQVGSAGGSCTPGPCTASDEWAINGAELGTGVHTLTVVATDNAGNIATKTYSLTVYHASPIAIGAGSVNPESGDYAMESSDVEFSGGLGSLGVSRHYDSRNTNEGAAGPLGPQWGISLGGLASLEVLPDSSVMVVGAQGLTHFALKSGGGYEAPPGDTNLMLEYVSKTPAYILRDPQQGTTTEFTLPKGATLWMPTVSKGPVATDTTTDEYKSVEVAPGGSYIVEPTLELAPHPNATCAHSALEKLEIVAKGCRALEFVYAEATTSKGEAKSEWGEYKNRLKEVLAVAYSPASSAMVKTPVAAYEYDLSGRLRAEWNPKISPGLKTIYGYDSEGHVTAVTPPGQESWAFTYGTIAGDASTGRLLKVTRAPASAPLWNGLLPKDTEAPKVTGTAIVGVRLAVSNGVWSNEPVAYGYKWEDCNSAGGECTPILGATNANYTVTSADVGRTLVAVVSAINGGGAVTAASAASAMVGVTGTEYALAAGTEPFEITVGPDKNLWYTGLGTGVIGKMTTSGSVTQYTLPAGHDPEGITAGPDGNLWYDEWDTSTLSDEIGKITTSGSYTEYPVEVGPRGLTTGPDGNIWGAAFHNESDIEKITTAGVVTRYKTLVNAGNPQEIAVGPEGDLWYADTTTGGIGKITTAGAITEYKLAENAQPTGITEGPDGNIWFAEWGTNKICKMSASGTILAEYKLPEKSGPEGIATGPDGNIWVAESDSHKIAKITTSGVITEFTLPTGTYPWSIVKGPDGELWFTEPGTSKIGKMPPAGNVVKEGEKREPGPGAAIEYQVPLTGGSGLPVMTSTELAKWAQKDDPESATAIFPATKPVGWPAGEYAGASVYYMDSDARTVNVANPAGGISTREFNAGNAITRALSASDRATALKEANPAEASELLSTKSTYGTEGELEQTWGPQHEVKLASGKGGASEDVLARNHVHYYYNEGAKEVEEKKGEQYELVTKVIDGAETATKEEFDQRTATTSYSGQSNLGWTLRKPTSQTADPSGLDLTTTTTYESSTGDVTETKSPAATGKNAHVPLAYSTAFGTKGAGANQLNGPTSDALDASGNVWVADYSNNRLDEFNSSGTFIAGLGYGVSNGEAKLETCTTTTTCKAGIVGSADGEFDEPTGVAISGGVIYVADYLNDRIEEFNEKDEYVTEFASKGTARGQLEGPVSVAIGAGGSVWVGDLNNLRLDEFNASGEPVEALGWGVSNGESKFEICTTTCQVGLAGSGAGQFSVIQNLAITGGDVFVADYGDDRVDEFNEAGEYASSFGSKGTGNGQFEGPAGIAPATAGGILYVTDWGNDRVEKFSTSGTYISQFASKGTGKGQLQGPEGIIVNSSGAAYVVDNENNRLQKWVTADTGAEGAHDEKTIYYTSAANTTHPACGEQPQWVGLLCETVPAAQPGTSGLPSLPETTITYNLWNQPESVIETFGTTVRTTTTTFDGAGRPLSTEETSSIDTALPKVTDKYNKENGSVETQSTTVGETTKTITSLYNRLGRLESYTDADGNTATYKYDSYGRISEVDDGSEAGAGKQKYTYSETTSALTTLLDSGAGTFGSSYDVEGRPTTVTYPNGMTATYTYNSIGSTTGLEYKKTTDCTESCVLFKDTVVPSVHGETVKQASTFAEEPNYTYDAAGRLTQVQEIPTGEGCKTRIYAYDEDNNRTTETTREPGTEGKCATEGSTTEWHKYDSGDRMTDSGVAYEAFGDTTTLPAADAGGSELTSGYYVDGQVAHQTQAGETLEYELDPEERPREVISSGNTSSAVVDHYDGPGSTASWSIEPSTGKWTREIPGINQELAAVKTSTGGTDLQLHDLDGNVVATIGDSETETKLLSKYNSSEFGVPTSKEQPPKFAWQGASGYASELLSGAITQDGSTYVPQTGRELQTQAVTLPAPVNVVTPYVSVLPPWVAETAGRESAVRVSEVEEQKREREEAENPPGNVPPPGGEGGGGGGGGRAPIGETTTLEGSCSGVHACAASYTSCKRESLFGEGETGVLWLVEAVNCTKKVSYVQLELQIWVLNPSTKKYELLYHNGKNLKGEYGYNTTHAASLIKHICAEGLDYKAWVWGYASGPNFWFNGAGQSSGEWTCEGNYGGFITELFEIADG